LPILLPFLLTATEPAKIKSTLRFVGNKCRRYFTPHLNPPPQETVSQ
jgi:hypothetical protein